MAGREECPGASSILTNIKAIPLLVMPSPAFAQMRLTGTVDRADCSGCFCFGHTIPLGRVSEMARNCEPIILLGFLGWGYNKSAHCLCLSHKFALTINLSL